MKSVRTVLLVLVALVLAACGGNGDSAEDDTPTPTTPTESDPINEPSDGDTSDDSATDLADTDIGEFFDTAGGTATVTIGDETWEFVLAPDVSIASCDADFFGGFVAILVNEGADMTSPMDAMTMRLPGGDFTDPPILSVNLGASGELEWIADETIYKQNADLPDGLGVTGFSIDGNTASGTATFFEQESFFQFGAGLGDLVTADGTFTVTCASDE